MTATIPSASLVSHSVFPFCPLYPSVFCLISIIFHNLSSANISYLFASPLSWLDSLNWNDVFVSCCSISNLIRMFTAWQLLWTVQALQEYFYNLSRASSAMLSWGFFSYFIGWEYRGGVSILFRFSLSSSSLFPVSWVVFVTWSFEHSFEPVLHLWGLTAEFHWERAWESEREEKRVRGTVCKKWEEGQREERRGRRK